VKKEENVITVRNEKTKRIEKGKEEVYV